MADETAAGYLDARIDALREHVVSLIAAVPGLPRAFAGVLDQLAQEWQARGAGYNFGLIAAFLLLGFAVEGAYRYLFSPRMAGGRLRTMALRFARELGALAVFTLGSAALFLSFDWLPRTRQAVVAFLVAFIVVRVVMVASRALFSPREPELRVLPSSDAEALARHRRIVLFAAWFAFG